jgi:predicted GNAT family acetyltransferase
MTAEPESAPDPRDEIQVRDVPAEHRFEILLGGRRAGVAVYRREGDAYAFLHTEIDPEFEGRGLGSRLVKDALDDVRRQGVPVLPYCPFTRAYIQRHREYADLVPAAHHARFGL